MLIYLAPVLFLLTKPTTHSPIAQPIATSRDTEASLRTTHPETTDGAILYAAGSRAHAFPPCVLKPGQLIRWRVLFYCVFKLGQFVLEWSNMFVPPTVYCLASRCGTGGGIKLETESQISKDSSTRAIATDVFLANRFLRLTARGRKLHFLNETLTAGSDKANDNRGA